MKTSNQEIKDKLMRDSLESDTIHKLFEEQLKEIFWAEQELTRFMPKVVGMVTSKDLIKTLRDHMKISEQQVRRLEKVFQIQGVEAEGEKCDGMEGLIMEAEKIIDSSEKDLIRDAFIIGAVQKVEHYEMASYGTLKAIATILGEYEIATLLGVTLKEEKDADMKLTEVAENIVNIDASRKAGELEEEEESDFEEDEEEEDEQENDMDEDEFGDSDNPSSRPKSGSKTRI